ncbi:MAG: STAS domain-containing protein [Pseudomonadota bacterium]
MSEHSVDLPPRLRFSEAQALQQEILAQPADTVLTLNASGVEEMSTAAVLVILAAQISAKAQQIAALQISGASDPFMDAFTHLGLFSELMKLEFTL